MHRRNLSALQQRVMEFLHCTLPRGPLPIQQREAALMIIRQRLTMLRMALSPPQHAYFQRWFEEQLREYRAWQQNQSSFRSSLREQLVPIVQQQGGSTGDIATWAGQQQDYAFITGSQDIIVRNPVSTAGDREEYVDVDPANRYYLTKEDAKEALEKHASPHALVSRKGGKKNLHFNYQCHWDPCKLRAKIAIVAQQQSNGKAITLYRALVSKIYKKHTNHPFNGEDIRALGDLPLPQRIKSAINRLRANDIRQKTSTADCIMRKLLDDPEFFDMPHFSNPLLKRRIKQKMRRQIKYEREQFDDAFEVDVLAATFKFISQYSLEIPVSYHAPSSLLCFEEFYQSFLTATRESLSSSPLLNADINGRFALFTLPHPPESAFVEILGRQLTAQERLCIERSIVFTSLLDLHNMIMWLHTYPLEIRLAACDGVFKLLRGRQVIISIGGLDVQWREAQRRVTRSFRSFGYVVCPKGEAEICVICLYISLQLAVKELAGIELEDSKFSIGSCDHSDSIAAAFEALGADTIANCWSHLIRLFSNTEWIKKYFADVDYAPAAKRHVCLIALSRTTAQFQTMFKLVMQKWQEVGETVLAEHFAKEYGPNTIWYQWFYSALEQPGLLPNQNPQESSFRVNQGSKRDNGPLELRKSVSEFLRIEARELLKQDYLSRDGVSFVVPTTPSKKLQSLCGLMGENDVRRCGSRTFVNPPPVFNEPITDERVQQYDNALAGNSDAFNGSFTKMHLAASRLCCVHKTPELEYLGFCYICECKPFWLKLQCTGSEIVKDLDSKQTPSLSAHFLPASGRVQTPSNDVRAHGQPGGVTRLSSEIKTRHYMSLSLEQIHQLFKHCAFVIPSEHANDKSKLVSMLLEKSCTRNVDTLNSLLSFEELDNLEDNLDTPDSNAVHLEAGQEDATSPVTCASSNSSNDDAAASTASQSIRQKSQSRVTSHATAATSHSTGYNAGDSERQIENGSQKKKRKEKTSSDGKSATKKRRTRSRDKKRKAKPSSSNGKPATKKHRSNKKGGQSAVTDVGKEKPKDCLSKFKERLAPQKGQPNENSFDRFVANTLMHYAADCKLQSDTMARNQKRESHATKRWQIRADPYIQAHTLWTQKLHKIVDQHSKAYHENPLPFHRNGLRDSAKALFCKGAEEEVPEKLAQSLLEDLFVKLGAFFSSTGDHFKREPSCRQLLSLLTPIKNSLLELAPFRMSKEQYLMRCRLDQPMGRRLYDALHQCKCEVDLIIGHCSEEGSADETAFGNRRCPPFFSEDSLDYRHCTMDLLALQYSISALDDVNFLAEILNRPPPRPKTWFEVYPEANPAWIAVLQVAYFSKIPSIFGIDFYKFEQSTTSNFALATLFDISSDFPACQLATIAEIIEQKQTEMIKLEKKALQKQKFAFSGSDGDSDSDSDDHSATALTDHRPKMSRAESTVRNEIRSVAEDIAKKMDPIKGMLAFTRANAPAVIRVAIPCVGSSSSDSDSSSDASDSDRKKPPPAEHKPNDGAKSPVPLRSHGDDNEVKILGASEGSTGLEALESSEIAWLSKQCITPTEPHTGHPFYERKAETAQEMSRLNGRCFTPDEDGRFRDAIAKSKLATANTDLFNTLYTNGNLTMQSIGRLKLSVSHPIKDRSGPEGMHLDDQLIEKFMMLLGKNQRFHGTDKRRPRCHFFSSFFMSKLMGLSISPSCDVETCPMYSFANIQSWLKSKRRAGNEEFTLLMHSANLFQDYDLLLFPINYLRNDHWLLAVADLNRKQVRLHDSFGSPCPEFGIAVIRALNDFHKTMFGSAMHNLHEWKVVACTTPQQDNFHDCGVYVCIFAYLYACGLPLPGSTRKFIDGSKWRRLMFHWLEQGRIE